MNPNRPSPNNRVDDGSGTAAVAINPLQPTNPVESVSTILVNSILVTPSKEEPKLSCSASAPVVFETSSAKDEKLKAVEPPS